MTSPTSVGAVEVEILGDASSIAKRIRQDVEDGLKGLDVGKKIKDSVGKDPIKVPVDPEVDTESIPEKVKGTKVPKVPVELDPLVAAFQAEVRRQTDALARQANVSVPIRADTGGLRAEIGASLAAVQRQLKVTVPTEPSGKAEYEAKLKALVAEASARVKATVKVTPVVQGAGGGGGGALSGFSQGLQSLVPNLGGVTSAIQGLFTGFGKLASAAAPAGSALAGLGQAAGPIGAVASAVVALTLGMGGLAAAATVAGPALLAAAGAAAAIPAALSGIGALVGTLKLGFKGISEAFAPKTGGGGGGGAGSVVNQARQMAAAARAVEAAKRGITAANRGLENAERTLATAQRGEVESLQRLRVAQAAVAQARKDAVDDIDDLNRALRSSKLSEEEAAQAIHDAALALDEAKLAGDIPSINRARQAYERAQLTLEDTADASEDLQKQVDKTNKLGVDGTDRVQQALKDQLSATEDLARAQESIRSAQDGILSAQDGLISATDSLKSAQEGLAAAQTKVASGAGGVAQKVIKLAPAAQAFVDAVKSFGPEFERLRLDVQQRLFQGLGDTFTNVMLTWQGTLRSTLLNFAGSINEFARNLGTAISNVDFIFGVAQGADGFRLALVAIGKSVTDSLVPAFGDLAEAAAPFLKSAGETVAGLVRDFGTWIRQAKDSGQLQDFFTRAAAAFKAITTTGKLVAQIIGDVFNIITGADPASGKTALDSFNDGLAAVHRFLSDPQNVAQMKQFVSDLKDGLTKFVDAAKGVYDFLNRISGGSEGKSAGEKVGLAIVAGIAVGIKEAFVFHLKNILPYFGPLGPLVGGVKKLLGIKSPSTVFAEIGRNVVQGFANGIASLLGYLGQIAGRIRVFVVNPVSNAGSWLYGYGRNAIIGLANGIASVLSYAGQVAGNARIYVQNALYRAGSWLYSAGQNVVYGLYNGITSLGGWLRDRLIGWVQAHVPEPIRWALGINSPSKVTFGLGQQVSKGLALGIEDQAAQVKAAADLVAAQAIPQVDATFGLGSDMDAAISRSLSVASKTSLEAKWKAGATGSPLLDALRGMIEFEFNGDPVAALGS